MPVTKIQPLGVNSEATFTFANVNVTANLVSNNANLGNAATANFFIGNGSLLTGLPASYNDSNVANYLPNYTGNISAGNINLASASNLKISGGTANYVLKTDGAGNLSWVEQSGGSGSPGGSNTQIQFNDNTAFAGSANLTFDKTTNTLSVTNITANGAGLTNIAGANVTGFVPNANVANTAYSVSGGNVSGQVANALVAGTVYTNSQPNITSVGTLTSLGVTGNVTAGNITSNASLTTVDATITGNLTVQGNTTYINVTELALEDPLIQLGTNPNNAPLTTNDGKDRGLQLHYYSGSDKHAFMGWDNSNGEFAFGSNVSTVNDVVTFTELGNIRANYFLGDGSQLTGITATTAVSLINGTSNIIIDANSNVRISANGVANVVRINGGEGNVVTIAGNLDLGGNYIRGNGALLTGVDALSALGADVANSIANGSSNINTPVSGGNITVSIGGVGNTVVFSNTGTFVSGNLSMKNYSLIVQNLGSVTGATTINLNDGAYVKATSTGTTTWTFANSAPINNASGFTLELSNGGSYTQNWPLTVKWPNGSAPELTITGVDLLVFLTNDNGTTWRGAATILNSV